MTDAPPAIRRAVRDPGSFRDPAASSTAATASSSARSTRRSRRWDGLVASGLLAELRRRGLLDRRTSRRPSRPPPTPSAHAVIRPEPIEFISYPYEWTFGQLKDAALADARRPARGAGAPASRSRTRRAYNVQFRDGRPILIDSLSFEPPSPARRGSPTASSASTSWRRSR